MAEAQIWGSSGLFLYIIIRMRRSISLYLNILLQRATDMRSLLSFSIFISERYVYRLLSKTRILSMLTATYDI